MVKNEDDVLYTGRLYLFDIIPLWKTTKTKREWKQTEMEMSSRNQMVMSKFDDEEEREDDKNV